MKPVLVLSQQSANVDGTPGTVPLPLLARSRVVKSSWGTREPYHCLLLSSCPFQSQNAGRASALGKKTPYFIGAPRQALMRRKQAEKRMRALALQALKLTEKPLRALVYSKVRFFFPY